MQVRQSLPAALALATVLLLTACGKADDGRTPGQKLDAAISQIDQKTQHAVAEAKSELQNKDQLAGAVKEQVKDASITAAINAELMKDRDLSVLKIDVDTHDGRVVLKGSAPDTAAKDRATSLAQRVAGVAQVDNQLQIRGN